MKYLSGAALATGSLAAKSEPISYEAISRLQVNQRTLQNHWSLLLDYQVDAEEKRDPKDNWLYVTLTLKNDKVVDDFKRRIKNGEIFQTYFSMKDVAQQQMMTVDLPAPTENLDVDIVQQEVDVPFWENFVCGLEYDSTTKNVTPYPKTV